MKSIFVFSSCLFAMFGWSQAFAQNIDIPTLAPRTVDTVFSPLGFDDNDNVEIILHGHYESSCYTNGPVTFSVDEASKKITIKARSYFHIGSPCRPMSISWVQPIQLGLLKAGTYSLRIEGNPHASFAPLVVKAAEVESQDDYMYANITAAFISQDDTGKQMLNVVGTFPKVSIGCLMMKDLKISSTPGKVLVVLPIMELKDGWICQTAAAQPNFYMSRELPFNVEADELIHVRSANGTSFNALFQ